MILMGRKIAHNQVTGITSWVTKLGKKLLGEKNQPQPKVLRDTRTYRCEREQSLHLVLV